MENNKQSFSSNKHSAGFMNGFMWGAVIGGGLVFLLATKKGRKILRDLSETGEDFINDFSALEDMKEVEEYETEEAAPKSSSNKRSFLSDKQSFSSNKSSPHDHNGQSFGKRFFKGAKKK